MVKLESCHNFSAAFCRPQQTHCISLSTFCSSKIMHHLLNKVIADTIELDCQRGLCYFKNVKIFPYSIDRNIHKSCMSFNSESIQPINKLMIKILQAETISQDDSESQDSSENSTGLFQYNTQKSLSIIFQHFKIHISNFFLMQLGYLKKFQLEVLKNNV